MLITETQERFAGFYLIEGFWAIDKPDYSKFGSHYWLAPEYSKIMEEVVVTKYRNDQKIIIYRDGMIAFTDKELLSIGATNDTFRRVEKYTDILNALFGIFAATITHETGIKYHTNFEVTHHDVVSLLYENGRLISNGLPQKSTTNTQLMKRYLSHVPSGYTDDLDLYIDSPGRPIIREHILNKACDIFLNAYAQGGEATIKLLARSNKAAAEFAGTSFSDSVLISWLQIETYLYAKLMDYVAKGGTRFNRERRAFLEKDTPISQIIELLEVANEISSDLYSLLTRVRKVRNKIVHTGHVATANEASDALILLEKIIEEKIGTAIKLNTGLVMSPI